MNDSKDSPAFLSREAKRLIFDEDLQQLQAFLSKLPAGTILPATENGLSPLQNAASADLPAFCKALLPYSDPKAATPSGRTALMLACQYSPASVPFLLPLSDPSALDKDGLGALALCAERGRAKTLALLLPRCDPNQRFEFGMSALMLAARSNHPDCVHALLPACDPDQLDDDGWSALMWAAHCGSAECFDALACASDAGIRAHNGLTARLLSAPSICRRALLVKLHEFRKKGGMLRLAFPGQPQRPLEIAPCFRRRPIQRGIDQKALQIRTLVAELDQLTRARFARKPARLRRFSQSQRHRRKFRRIG